MKNPSLKIALVSPSATFEPQKLEEALLAASHLNLSVVGHTRTRHGAPPFLNGTKQERLAELAAAEMLGADALWCTRGGSGALELWHDYNKEFYSRHEAPLIGY